MNCGGSHLEFIAKKTSFVTLNINRNYWVILATLQITSYALGV
jgi:hypothetical protein